MSNRPNYYKSESPEDDKTQKPVKNSKKKTIITVGVAILIVLLLFWLLVAEDIGAWSGWSNP